MMKREKVIFFDGICNLCNSSVQWIIKRDAKNKFKFSSLQSDFGREFLQKNNFDTENLSTIIYSDGDKIYTESSAILNILAELGGFYILVKTAFCVPKFIRDKVYKFISKNRYKWFGKKESCWIPTPELKEKFLQ